MQEWLEWAGSKLLAMPIRTPGPELPRAFWPAIVADEISAEGAGFRLRIGAPTNDEIPLMDRILLLPNLCADPFKRKVIHARSLVSPRNGRHLVRWTKIAFALHTDARTVRRWYWRGLREIGERVETDVVYTIRLSFAPPSPPCLPSAPLRA